MKKDITIKASDNGEFSAFVVYPETDSPVAVLIVIQEIFGVNENMRKICEHLASAGYIAICPDLFWRQEPNVQLDDKEKEDWDKALTLFQGFNVDLGIEDLKSTLNFIRTSEYCNGHAGTVGYCLGGKLAFLMAARSDADCNISYYGVGIQDHLDEANNITTPLLMHMAEKDEFVPLEAQQKIISKLNPIKNIDVHVYSDVDHAFARVGGEHYDKEAAHRANFSTADFLATHLDVKTS